MIVGFTGPDSGTRAAVAVCFAEKTGISLLSGAVPGDIPAGDWVLTGTAAELSAAVREVRDPVLVDLGSGDAAADLRLTAAGASPTEIARAVTEALPAAIFQRDFRRARERVDAALLGRPCRDVLDELSAGATAGDYVEALLRYCRGGKRIRAFLVQAGYGLRQRWDEEKILLPSLACELFQSGILIHDDLIDESEVRRGAPTIHVALGNDHDARSKALCVGDMGIVFSHAMILRSGFSPAQQTQALRHLTRVYTLTISGELKDIELGAGQGGGMEDVLSMYAKKTSWYTFIGPMQLGAILGGADQTLLDSLERAGLAMGIAFQIRDDILGIFGDVDVTGKSNLSDLQEGKATVLHRHFLAHAPAAARAELETIYGKRSSGVPELLRVRALLAEAGSLDYAQAQCRSYLDAARDAVNAMEIPLYSQWMLNGLLDYLDRRKK